jgi:23S rRNA (cytosine1962-C5)-methyltransferase
LAVDRYGEHFWVTEWESEGRSALDSATAATRLAEFYLKRGARSVCLLERPLRGLPAQLRCLGGVAPTEPWVVAERGRRYEIRFGGNQTGLFLDHAPLRDWLQANVGGMRVLNTFSYTGTLSVAAGLARARAVTTLDLAKPAIAWARANWSHNGLPEDSLEQRARFLAADVFESLPRMKRANERYDCVILDPPSFSRSKQGASFSTAKDLRKLHDLAFSVLEAEGVLVTSLNSAQLARAQYATKVLEAARAHGVSLQVVREIQLPETFPTPLGAERARYLKGWILRTRRS